MNPVIQIDQRQKKLSWLLFFIVFGAEFAFGCYMALKVGFIHSDALSRVANAFFVLYSREPHLGAIGFIWNPLPSLLEAFVLLLYPVFPVLATHGLASVVVTSFFAGATAKLIYDAGTSFGLSAFLKICMSLLYCFNPFFFLFGADGMSDTPFIYFIMYATFHLTIWFYKKGPSSLLKCGFGLSLAFWIRYEAAFVGIAVAVCILLIMFEKENEKFPFKERFFKVEASVIIALTPLVFSGFLWIFFNYTIMGNPLYFLNSEYSNTAQSQILTETSSQIQSVRSNFFTLIFYIWGKMVWFSVPFLTLMLLSVINRKFFSKETIKILALYLCVPVLQILLLLMGSSMVFFRYFMYILPLMVAVMPSFIHFSSWKKISALLCMVSLILSGVVLGYALTKPSLAGDENNLLQGFVGGGYYYTRQKYDREVSEWIEEHIPDESIVTDSSSSYGIILNSKNAKKYIINSDNTLYKGFLSNPASGIASYVLVPNNLLSSNLPSKINDQFPKLFKQGMPWAELYKDFNDQWRLYKIVK